MAGEAPIFIYFPHLRQPRGRNPHVAFGASPRGLRAGLGAPVADLPRLRRGPTRARSTGLAHEVGVWSLNFPDFQKLWEIVKVIRRSMSFRRFSIKRSSGESGSTVTHMSSSKFQVLYRCRFVFGLSPFFQGL